MYLDIDEPPEPKLLEPGTIVAERYRIVDSIGKGGMGVVYKASNIHMGKTVAMKMMLQETSTNSQDYRRFQREAQAASLLDHPNIVSIHDFGFSSGQAYLCMDYLEGTSLDCIVEKQPLTLDQFRHIFAQACDALQHAHDKGIVHRDLKPSNIMITERRGDKNYVVILDFGLVKMMETGGDHKLTATNMVVGSPLYMSPEQCRAQPLDQRSDIYSLGCVMYEALTGRPPLMADTIFDLMSAHISQEPAPLRDALPGLYVPAALEKVILQALAKDPARRFQSMKELAKAIEDSFSGAPELAISRPIPAYSKDGINPAASRSIEIARKEQKQHKIMSAAVAVWIVLGAGAIVKMKFDELNRSKSPTSSQHSPGTSTFASTNNTPGSSESDPIRLASNNQETSGPPRPLTPIPATHYPTEKEPSPPPGTLPPPMVPPNAATAARPLPGNQIPGPIAPISNTPQISSSASNSEATPEQLLNQANAAFRFGEYSNARQKYESVLRARSGSDVQVPVYECLIYCCYKTNDSAATHRYANQFKNLFFSYQRYVENNPILLEEVMKIVINTLGSDNSFQERALQQCIEMSGGASQKSIQFKMDLARLFLEQRRQSEALRCMEDAQRDAESVAPDRITEIQYRINQLKGPSMSGPPIGGGPSGGPMGGGPMGGGPMGGPIGGGPMGGPMGGGQGGGPMGGPGGGPMGGPPGGEDGGMFGPPR